MRGVAEEPSDAYLLAETAAASFPSFGFSLVERPGVPEGVRGSMEFFSACPQGTRMMSLPLDARAGYGAG